MNMKNIIIIVVGMFLLTSCAKSLIPIPGSIVPERSNNVQLNADYGQYPENYRKILKDYLIESAMGLRGDIPDIVKVARPL